MFLLSSIYKTILDALFPVSPAEQALFALQPEEAYAKLPPAPDYSGLAVELPGSRSVFAYKDERVAKLVWSIKYKKSVHAVKIGGYALFKALIESDENVVTFPKSQKERVAGDRANILVIPMPITTRRRKERGYNQCELLLDEMERLQKSSADQRVGPNVVFEKNVLVRTQHASRQTLKGRADRVESAKGIFSVNEKADKNLANFSQVVIMDDVITTGSTMHEAIETMKKAGFENVAALSLAH